MKTEKPRVLHLGNWNSKFSSGVNAQLAPRGAPRAYGEGCNGRIQNFFFVLKPGRWVTVGHREASAGHWYCALET